MTDYDDEDLIRRISARDQSALSDLYQRYSSLVYGLALRVLGDSALAEEAAQDTFLKVWHQAHAWDPGRGRLVTWLMTIARYTAIDRLRKERRQSPWPAVELEDVFDLIGQFGAADDPRWLDARVLENLARQLPEEQLQAIDLAFYKGMTHSEMAEHLKLPLGTVKGRVRAGLQRLKKLWLDAAGD